MFIFSPRITNSIWKIAPTRLASFLTILILFGCTTNTKVCAPSPQVKGIIDQTQLLADLSVLSSDQMLGRKTASSGSKKAQEYIAKRFAEIGLAKFGSDYLHPFRFGSLNNNQGTNIIAWIEGTEKTESFFVVTAHYDHLGVVGGKIFNGADDNASGVSAMLNIAQYLSKNPSKHSVIFVATDAEEPGLFGAKAFVESPPVDLDKIKYNINLDMVSRGERKNRLYIAATHHNIQIAQSIEYATIEAGICLKRGHEGVRRDPGSVTKQIDWSKSSDHAIFISKQIPYLYFGVDPHKDYHKPSDTYDKVEPVFFTAAVEAILSVFNALD